MNALVGQEAKSNCSLFWLIRDECANDGGRKDGGDFASAGAGGHLRGRCEFEVLHDSSTELKPSRIMCLMFRTGWQLRVMASNRLIFSGLALALLVSAGAVWADTVTGRVVAVTDGDTIKVLDSDKRQHTIRVAGIDAPEKKQPFGQRSKENLSRLVFGKEVDVQWSKHDRYQRIVGKVMVAEPGCQRPGCSKTLDAGLGQVTAGFAWWYRKYAREQATEDAARYESAEADARTRRLGLWSDAEPMPPWDWRKGKNGG